MEVSIIRKTKSTCPVCLRIINAVVVEESGKVFLLKECNVHQAYKILLSNNAQEYRELERFYFSIANRMESICEIEMWITLKCNMRCPICHLGEETRETFTDPSLGAIERYIQKEKTSFFILSGGEPTCRSDLNDVVKLCKKYNKMVSIHTNGVKLADVAYLKKLMRAGLDRVNLQFDGFEKISYELFRGEDVWQVKMQLLENLKKLNISTDLNITIARNVNEKEINQIIQYAAQNNFINSINFFTLCYLGEVREHTRDRFIMPDELLDILARLNGGVISLENLYTFQKLHYVLKAIYRKKFCLYSRLYVFVRQNNICEPINKYMNMARAEKLLEKYERFYKINKNMASVYFICALPSIFFTKRIFKIMKEMILTGYSYLFQTSYHQKNRGLFYVNFNTGCDPLKYDAAIVPYCQDEIIKYDETIGEMKNVGADGERAIALERERLQRRQQ